MFLKGTKTNCCNGWVENEIGYEVVALIDQTVFVLFFSFSIFSPVLERVFLVLLTTCKLREVINTKLTSWKSE